MTYSRTVDASTLCVKTKMT